MNNFRINDIIEFGEENIKVKVLVSYILNGVEYLYVVQVDDNEEPLDKVDVLQVNLEDATLTNVRDENIISQLQPIFEEKLNEIK